MTEPLYGHCTMLIDGECYTFPLPLFHDTIVEGWGPGRVGTFDQYAWPSAAVAEHHRAQARHDTAERRFGWVRRLPGRVRVRRHMGWDEDGDDMGYAWVTLPLASILARWLIPKAPGNKGNHRIEGNEAEYFVLMDTFGVLFQGNLIVTAQR